MRRQTAIDGRKARRFSSSKAGFTLLELLVAATIAVGLAGLMLAVVSSTLNLWQRTQAGFSTASQAKLVLDMIERDLQTAVFRKDGNTWLAVDVINLPSALVSHGWLPSAASKPATVDSQRLLPNVADGGPPLLGNARFGLSGAWVRFITSNTESGGSLPVAVSYQVIRRPVSGSVSASNPADRRYILFRSAISAENTFACGNDVTAPEYGSLTSTPAAPRDQATLTNPNGSDALATDIVDLGIWFYVHDSAGGLRRIFPAGASDASHSAQDTGLVSDDTRFPEVADVMVRLLSDNGAALLAEIENGAGHLGRPAAHATDADWWWAVVEANSQVFIRRVEMKGASL